MLAEDPDSPSSLGIAISEAVEVAAMSNGEKKYSLGSVLNHVLMHQTVIGQEVLMQLEMADEYPDIIVGCTGRIELGGFAFPFCRRISAMVKTRASLLRNRLRARH